MTVGQFAGDNNLLELDLRVWFFFFFCISVALHDPESIFPLWRNSVWLCTCHMLFLAFWMPQASCVGSMQWRSASHWKVSVCQLLPQVAPALFGGVCCILRECCTATLCIGITYAAAVPRGYLSGLNLEASTEIYFVKIIWCQQGE